MPISRYQKNLPLFASYFHLQVKIILRPLVPLLKQDFKIWPCFFDGKVSAQYIIFQNFLETYRSFLFILQRISDLGKKLSHHELVCLCRIQNLGEFILSFLLEDFRMLDEMMILWIIFVIKKMRKVCSDQ